ncbi:hypothetical protein BLNAU_15638 [Blattamonas nauphoetae]|uniref:Uncharacterized protein n=1 Tax=Blattamonas nauphoetae TaxID=2049346 RepID=A0ABQ9XDR5_9EUKA|nr:hypothetical protein BLNAU_15638 [Blattamonas nauphoetae]
MFQQSSFNEPDVSFNLTSSFLPPSHHQTTSDTPIRHDPDSHPALTKTVSDHKISLGANPEQLPHALTPPVKPEPRINEQKRILDPLSQSVSVSPFPSEVSDDANSSHYTIFNNFSFVSDRSSQLDVIFADSQNTGSERHGFSLPTSPNLLSPHRRRCSDTERCSKATSSNPRSHSSEPVKGSPTRTSPSASPPSPFVYAAPHVDQTPTTVLMDGQPSDDLSYPTETAKDPLRFAALSPPSPTLYEAPNFAHREKSPKIILLSNLTTPPVTQPPRQTVETLHKFQWNRPRPQAPYIPLAVNDPQNRSSGAILHPQAIQIHPAPSKPVPNNKFQVFFPSIPQPIPLDTITPISRHPPPSQLPSQTVPNFEQIIQAKNAAMLQQYLAIFPSLHSSQRFVGTVMSTWNKMRGIAWLYSADFPDNVFCDLRKLPAGDIDYVCPGAYIRFSICLNQKPQSVFAADHPVVIFK